jgi:ADP-ribose pyrophosphatase YjhB (NUDIX family)
MIKCQFEDSKEADALLRHVVTDVIALKDGQLLLAKRAVHLTNGGKWGLPGGYVGRDESVEEAALRELEEEAGYSGKIVKFLGYSDKPDRKGDDLRRQNIAFIYEVEITGKKGEMDHETSEVKFFDLDNLPPEEEWAFDHFENVSKYLKSR